MTAEVYVTITLGLEILALWWATRVRSALGVQVFCIVNMLMIATFAGRLTTVCGLTSNVGNFWYASVFAGQLIIYERYSQQAAADTVKAVLTAVTLWLGLIVLLILIPPPVPSPMSAAVKLIGDWQSRVIVASYLAFVIAQVVLLATFRLLQRWRFPLRYLAAVLCGQVVDSLVFFPVAFNIRPGVTRIMIDGFLLKMLSGAVLMPVVWRLGGFRCPEINKQEYISK